MNTRRCPNCDYPLPAQAKYCIGCGKALISAELAITLEVGGNGEDDTIVVRPHFMNRATSFIPHLFAFGNVRVARPATVNRAWRRVKEHITMQLAAASLMAEQADMLTIAEDASLELLYPKRKLTWQKVVEQPSMQETAVYPPRPVLAEGTAEIPLLSQREAHRPVSPLALFWLSVIVLVIVGGIFGVANSLGRQGITNDGLSLTATPQNVAIGATMELRGSGFTAHSRVGLSRDGAVPVSDTVGNTYVTSDAQGKIADTIVARSDWGAGSHTINAEDALTHKAVSFPIQVTGEGGALLPAHLRLSVNNLDMADGDQATNSLQRIALSNQGSGEISWQASSNQSWLLFAPNGGTFYSGTHSELMVAVARANLLPGNYTAQINFTSSAGNAVLFVKMHVTALSVNGKAVLQLTPPLLTFTAPDGTGAPTGQVVTVSNPGVLALNWTSSSNVPWLALSSSYGSVWPGSSTSVTVTVDTRKLLPGTYSGTITIHGQAFALLHSPQTIDVSVTITPHCALILSSNMLTFSSTYQQSAPASQPVNLGTSASCAAPLSWQAASHDKWLSVDNQKGTTPSVPALHVDPTGMMPGSYDSSVVFTSSAGTQTLLVKFDISEESVPDIKASPAAIAFTGIANSASPPAQTLTLTNSGATGVNWNLTPATDQGGNWLGATPASGSLAAYQSKTITISVAQGTLAAGTYNGVLNMSETGLTGRSGHSQTIPVSLTLKPACAISGAPQTLTFNGNTGQAAPTAQNVTLSANASCGNTLNWTARVATEPAGGNWLTASPASGAISQGASAQASIGVALAGLVTGTYHGTVTFTAVDSVTKQAVGTPQVVTVAFNVQPSCTLQAPVPATTAFTATAGANPAAPQTVTVTVIGTCAGAVTLKPTAVMTTGAGWLSVGPDPVTIGTDGKAALTVTVTSATLAAGQYTGSISLAAINGGMAIAGSPQTVAVSLTVRGAAGTLTANPTTGLSFNATNGVVAPQSITLSNSGTGALNWTATLQAGAPAFVSLSANAGANLVAGNNATVTVNVNAAGVPTGTYPASILITALDAITLKPAAGSPITIPISIKVTAALPPTMQVSGTSLSFTTAVGKDPPPQAITIANAGGDTLTWSASASAQNWLSVSPPTGSEAQGASSALTFTVHAAGLTADTGTTVVITPSVGRPVSVAVTLTITGAAPTPTALVPTATRTPPATRIPTATSVPSATATRHNLIR